MPELPEIEHLKRTLDPLLVGARVCGVSLQRRDIASAIDDRGCCRQAKGRDLLAGSTITELRRHGKNLAIIAQRKGLRQYALCVHLGMSGQLRFLPNGAPWSPRKHVHCIWRLQLPSGNGRLIFRDPRRFGRLLAFDNVARLEQLRWNTLGPDALTVLPADLTTRLSRTQRPVKAALLDQRVVAGIGNIYADEALFEARIHPLSNSSRIAAGGAQPLARAIRKVLTRAIRSGGTTLRDYVDGNGLAGSYAAHHMVYGRAGCPCLVCGNMLCAIHVAQRTTVFCRGCQRRVD